MSDLKRSCPACGSWTSAIGIAFRDGDPCPYCGLPADVVPLIEKAEAKGVEQKVLDRLAQAEQRAAKAEEHIEALSRQLARVRAALDEEVSR